MTKYFLTDDFLHTFKKYCTDRMFPSALKDTVDRFLLEIDSKTITGIQYTTMCLILFQAMRNMLAGYGGSTCGKEHLYEAIGFHMGSIGQTDLYGDGKVLEKYLTLFYFIKDLQKSNKSFANLISNVFGETK